MKTANDHLKISVVIPAFNEADKIGNCLKSLAEQSYKRIETILIDDCSNDKTALIAREINTSLMLNLQIIQLSSRKERGVARNIGAKKSTCDYLLFIDADMILGKNVISECMKIAQKKYNIKAIIIPEKAFGEGFWAKCRKLEKRCYLGDDRIEAARFFNKNAFWSVGGWDEKMISGEDWDLTRRIRSKYKVGRIKSFIKHNENKLTLWKAIKKKFYYGSVSGIYLEKNPLSILSIVFFIFRPAYLRNWKLLASNPAHGIGMLLLKAIEMFAGGIGYLYSKLLSRS